MADHLKEIANKVAELQRQRQKQFARGSSEVSPTVLYVVKRLADVVKAIATGDKVALTYSEARRGVELSYAYTHSIGMYVEETGDNEVEVTAQARNHHTPSNVTTVYKGEATSSKLEQFVAEHVLQWYQSL